jgi:hypothetical protein
LNRFAFVVNNPLKYVDPSGHADRDPWNESICKLLPMFCQPQSPPLIMGEQNEAQLTVSQPIVMTGGIAIVEASSSEEEGKKGGGGGLLNLIRSILGGLGGGAAKKVIDEVSKDGDPTNEINAGYETAKNVVTKIGPKTSAGLAEAMTKWFGPKNNVFLRNNPNRRPTWATDAQLNEYLQVARDILNKYAKDAERFARDIQIQTERVNAILKELAQREAERGGQ